MSALPKSNILDIISSASTDNVDRLLPIPSSNGNNSINDKRSVLKSKAYVGMFQFSEEYEYDADRQQEYNIFEERTRNMNRRRYSMMDAAPINLDTANHRNDAYDRRKSVCAFSIPNWKVSPPDTPEDQVDKNDLEESSVNGNVDHHDQNSLSIEYVDVQIDTNNNEALIENEKESEHCVDNNEELSNSLSHTRSPAQLSTPITLHLLSSSQEEGCLKNSILKNNSNLQLNESQSVENCSIAPSSSLSSLSPASSSGLYRPPIPPTSSIRRKSCFATAPIQNLDLDNILTTEDASCLKKPFIKTRRSSVTFGAVEELSENSVKILHIPSIEEGDNNEGDEDHDQFAEEEEFVEKVHRKTRSKSLCPVPEHRSLLNNFQELPQSSSGKDRGNRFLPVLPGIFFNNYRSDSVDSGFSCASASSYSSSEDPSPPSERRYRSASVAVGMDRSLLQPDATEFSVWLKSVKKLIQLTKELKSFAADDERKDSAAILDGIAHQNVDVENVKKFVRHNDWPVSHEIRADLWRVLCHNKDFDSNKFLYTRQLEDLTKSGVKTFRPSFLSMDGIVIHDHGLKEQGAVTLQRLLIVIECVRPEIRYVPILYPLCAMFLHYLNAEETFACVIRLLSQGHTFVLQSELAVYASCHTLLSLLKKHKKSVYTMLKRRAGTSDDIKLAEVFSQWNVWIFKYMPFEYLVRVMDCFLVEGHKMLLRVALSLVYIWYKERSRDFPRPTVSNISVLNNNNNNNSSKFPLIRSSTLPSRTKHSVLGTGDVTNSNGKLLSEIDQNIAEINEQIIAIAQNCPISIQTLLDMGWAIRNFKHSTFENRQKHYENKFRDKVARIRAEKGVHRPMRSIYTAAFSSKIIDTEAASELINSLPSRFQLETPELLFRLSENGASFVQLWSQIDNADQSLLIIRSTNDEVFGAYCSSCWSERRDVRERAKTRYFGTGESFVWRLHPELKLPVVYPWSGQHSDHPDTCPQMFMTAGDKYMIIGSGGGGDSIAIRDELTSGLSYPCDTFESPALVENNAFEIDEMEVFLVVSGCGTRDD